MIDKVHIFQSIPRVFQEYSNSVYELSYKESKSNRKILKLYSVLHCRLRPVSEHKQRGLYALVNNRR